MTLRLAKSGVPWEIAATMSDKRRLAFVVALGEIEGGMFDWSQMRWQQPNT